MQIELVYSLRFNVSDLLRSTFGSIRECDLDVEPVELLDELSIAEPLSGHVRMARINRGIFVEVWADTAILTECSRCLTSASSSIEVAFKEEFHPVTDIITGLPIEIEAEPDAFRIDGNHELDLTEAFRQYLLMNEPMRVLCRPNCAGLCLQCGLNLNDGDCGCDRERVKVDDPVSAALREWLRQNTDSSRPA